MTPLPLLTAWVLPEAKARGGGIEEQGEGEEESGEQPNGHSWGGAFRFQGEKREMPKTKPPTNQTMPPESSHH